MQYRDYLAKELAEYPMRNLPLPNGYHLVGHVALLTLNFDDHDFTKEVAECTLRYDKRVRSVAIRKGPTLGDMRKPDYKLVVGDSDTLTTHVENGVIFRVDPLRLTFSGGNRRERISLPKRVQQSEFVVDMFACVGQFGLHIAKTSGAKVMAIEINPDAHQLLEENIRLNHVEDRMQAILGDCRTNLPHAIANRIIMGYLPGTIEFLPAALSAISRNGGIIHMHDSIPESEIQQYCNTINTLSTEWGFESSIHPRKIKHYSPGIVHYVFDISLQTPDMYEA